MKKNVWQMPKSSPYLQGSLVLDIGHLLVQVPKRSGVLWKRIVHKEFGMTSRKRCCSNSQKADVRYLAHRCWELCVMWKVVLKHSHSCRYLWEDSVGVVQHVDQGEGGEQGDAMMPLLVSLGQHAVLQAVQGRLVAGERLMAFLDDVYVATPTPDRVGPIYTTLDVDLYRHARVRINGGKTQVWNAAGIRARTCDELERIAQEADPRARVWRGSHLPLVQQGITVLGTPLGSVEFVQAHLHKTLADHDTLLSRIPLLDDTQSAWALLLHCPGSRANYLLRRATTLVSGGVWHGFSQPQRGQIPLRRPLRHYLCPWEVWVFGMPLAPVSRPSGQAGPTVCLSMIRQRHPEVALEMVRQLNGVDACPSLHAASGAARELTGVDGFEPPTWDALANGLRPPTHDADEFEPGAKRGWQHEAASRVESIKFLDSH